MHPILKIKKRARTMARRENIQLKEALTQIAQAQGFPNWTRYKHSVDTYWYTSSSFLNHWFVFYQKAKNYQSTNGGYLLTFKGQYFITTASYIKNMGFNPHDPVWAQIDFDVSQTQSLERFFNYYEK